MCKYVYTYLYIYVSHIYIDTMYARLQFLLFLFFQVPRDHLSKIGISCSSSGFMGSNSAPVRSQSKLCSEVSVATQELWNPEVLIPGVFSMVKFPATEVA